MPAVVKPSSRVGQIRPGHSVCRFVLPDELDAKIRREASNLRVWPAHVVERRLRESYDRRPPAEPPRPA